MKVKKRIDIPCGQTYLFELDDGNLLEAGDVFMARERSYGSRPYRFADFDNPSDHNKRVMTICTMAGCPVGCRFCASSRTFKRKLTRDEIVDQVTSMVDNGVALGRDADPNNAHEFRILYTRMGEPMLNADNVVGSVKDFIRMYPHVIVGMSTSGFRKGVDKFLESPEVIPYIDMQFSLHSTNDDERKWLFDGDIGKTMMSIPQIGEAVGEWAKHTERKTSLNVILFDGFTYDFKSLLDHFDREQIWLRLSPWNVVQKAEEHGFEGMLRSDDVMHKKPMSGENLKKIITQIEELGIVYSYAPAIDEEIKYQVACGQALEAFRLEVAETEKRSALRVVA
jgi:23S rRNA (adenine2503-C2)-methyltransferase